MNAAYYILQPDGSHSGPVPQAQIVAYLRQGVLRRENLVRRADLAEFFAIESYPEFAQAAVAPTASAVRTPKATRPKPVPESGGGKWIWIMVLVWLVLLGWGAKVGWDAWSENAAAKKRAAAEAWKKENLPKYEITKVHKNLGKGQQGVGAEVIIEGEVEEKESKIHPEYGRSERSEVYVNLALRSEIKGRIVDIPIKLETVRIKNGKGSFTIIQFVPMEILLKWVPEWESIKVDADIKYEK